MNSIYILKSACWLSGFALIYIIFLRNERFFALKRAYLLAGLVLSCILPLVTVHYNIPVVVNTQASVSVADYVIDPTSELPAVESSRPDLTTILLITYLAGIVVLIARLSWQVIAITNEIKKKKNSLGINGSSKIIMAERFYFSFSFFSYILIGHSVQGNDLKQIINHEAVHVKQKHWIDLVLAELIRISQWMNPFSWIYINLVRKNHEYLADEVVLRHSTDPAQYKAALLNQMFRVPVFSTSNSFSYSLNKTRFDMMKMIVTSPYRKLKLLLMLPVSAVIFYAFAEPEYINPPSFEIPGGTVITDLSVNQAVQTQNRDVSGTIITADGKALAGASIAVTGSKTRVRTGDNGNFKVSEIPENSYLLFSAKGFITQVLKPVFGSPMTIKLDKDPKYVPEPEMPNTSYPNYVPPKAQGGGLPEDALVIIDGVISEGNSTEKLKSIPTSEIISISVLKGETAMKKYGEKAKNGAIEVTTRKASAVSSSGDVPFVVVEQMPMYPGGDQALLEFIARNTRYPETARQNGIEGRVIVRFVVNAQGKVENAVVMKGVDPELDNEAVRVVSMLDNFVPGTQGGKPVSVYYMVPITFSLPLFTETSKSTLLRYLASNIVYPSAARSNSVTGQVLVRVKTEKGGVIKEVAVADAGSRLPRVHEVVVIGYKDQMAATSQGDLKLLEAEVIRVAATIGSAGIPELMQKNMEFIIPVTFDLKDK
ncbi:MAG TPA: TonB family protein [Bacteroidales bacterium]|nr:TonB family protein [Bacteroidales bacterium]